MNERKIKIQISVDDNEVKSSTRSVKNLEQAAKDVGKSGKNFNELEKEMSGVANVAARLSAGFTSAVAAIAGATTVVLGLAAGMSVAAKFGYDLAKSFADYASSVSKAQQVTGLATETLSALKTEVEIAGGDFEGLIDGIKDFTKTIGDAANGSEDAQNKLNRLGINGKKAITDLDGALQQGIKRILQLPEGVARSNAMMEMFGEESLKLLPILNRFDGDISKLIKQLKEYGVVLSEEDIRQSKEFNKILQELQLELRGLGLSIGRDVLPVARDFFKEVRIFIKENKAEIKDWADYTLETILRFARGLRVAPAIFKDIIKGDLTASNTLTSLYVNADAYENDRFKDLRRANAQNATQLGAPSDKDLEKFSGSNNKSDSYFKDFEKAKQEAERLQREREANAKSEISAQLSLFDNHLQNISNSYNQAFTALKEALKETTNPEILAGSFEALKVWYAEQVNKLIPAWVELTNQQNELEKKTQSERVLRGTQLQEKFKEIGQKIANDTSELNKAILDAQKKLTDEQIKLKEQEIRRAIELTTKSNETEIERRKLDLANGIISESQSVKSEFTFTSQSLEFSKSQLTDFLSFVKNNAEKYKEIQQEIALLDEEIAQKKLQVQQKVAEFITKDNEKAQEQLQTYQEYLSELNDKMRDSSKITEVERVQKELLTESYKNLTEVQKENLIQKAQEVDAYRKFYEEYGRFIDLQIEAQERISKATKINATEIRALVLDGIAQYQTLSETIADGILKIGESAENFLNKQLGKVGEIPLIGDLLKFGNQQIGQKISTTVLDIFFPEMAGKMKTGNPVVDKISESNNYLKTIANAFTGRATGVSAASGGSLNSLLKTLGVGGFAGGGGYTGSTGNTGNFLTPDLTSSGAGSGITRGYGQSSTSQLSTYSQLKSALFGDKGFGFNSGTIGGVASLAMLAGGLVGGGAGSFISNIGSGALMGLQFGGPVGAVIGGAVGLVQSIFGISAQRRKDEEIRDALMVQTLSDLNKIKAEMEAARPGINVQGLLDNAKDISSNYFTQANALKSDKTRKIAIKDGRERVGMYPVESQYPNALMNQIFGLSEGASLKEQIRAAASERDRRILPEFAQGGFIPARNGGHLAIVGEGGYDEFILSTDPRHKNRTMNLLSSFAEKMSFNVPKFEIGGRSSGANLSQSNPISFSTPTVVNNIEIFVEQDTDGIWKATAESSTGQQTIVNVIEKKYSDGKLKLRRK